MGITSVLGSYGFDVSAGLRVIAASDNQLGIRNSLYNLPKRLDHQFQALVSSPFPEGENAMHRIATLRKIRIYRAVREDAMSSHMHVISTVLFIENFPVARHQHGNRVREQQHSCRNCSCQPVAATEAYAKILQIHGVHQMVQCHMSIFSAGTRKQRNHQPGKSVEWISAEGAEQQVEPHYIWLAFA
jgi:hypothetical protein